MENIATGIRKEVPQDLFWKWEISRAEGDMDGIVKQMIDILVEVPIVK